MGNGWECSQSAVHFLYLDISNSPGNPLNICAYMQANFLSLTEYALCFYVSNGHGLGLRPTKLCNTGACVQFLGLGLHFPAILPEAFAVREVSELFLCQCRWRPMHFT